MFFFVEEIFQFHRNCFKKYGKSYRHKHFGVLIFVIVNAEDAKLILGTSKHIEKNLLYKPLGYLIGDALVRSQSEKWHQRRKLIASVFSQLMLKEFFETLQNNSKEFVKFLHSRVGNEINVTQITSRIILQMFCGLLIVNFNLSIYLSDLI